MEAINAGQHPFEMKIDSQPSSTSFFPEMTAEMNASWARLISKMESSISEAMDAPRALSVRPALLLVPNLAPQQLAHFGFGQHVPEFDILRNLV